MDTKNNTLLKGGLPLSSSDFVDPSKAKEGKSMLLSSINNIIELHKDKMNSIDNSNTSNKEAINSTIDTMTSDFKMDEYIFDDQIIRDNNAEQPANETNEQPSMDEQPFMDEQPIIIDNAVDPNSPMEFDHPEAEQFGEFVAIEDDEQPTDINNMSDNQGEPMFVLNDDEVGGQKKVEKVDKKAKKIKATATDPQDIKSGRKVAWLSYILFFIPLLFMRRNSFVRHHANEGLELNIMDVIAIALYLVPRFITATNHWVELGFIVCKAIGLILLALSIITKLFLIIFSLAGKEAVSPWFGKTKMIKK